MSSTRIASVSLVAALVATDARAQEFLPDGGFELGDIVACDQLGKLPDTWFQANVSDGADTYTFDCAALEGLDWDYYGNFTSLAAAADGVRFVAGGGYFDEAFGTQLVAPLVAGEWYRLSGSFARRDWTTASFGYEVFLSSDGTASGHSLGTIGVGVGAGAWTQDVLGFFAPNDPAAIYLVLTPLGDLSESYTAVDALSLQSAGTFVEYGDGLAGSGGFVPHLAGSGAPTPGGTVDLTVTDGRGGAFGLLAIGVAADSLPLAGGTLLVDPLLFVPHLLGGAAGVAGAGSITLSGALPADDALVGFSGFFQAIYADPGAARRVSFSNGLEMVIG